MVRGSPPSEASGLQMVELNVVSRRPATPEAVRLVEIRIHKHSAQVPPEFVAEILGKTSPKLGARQKRLREQIQRDQRVVDGDAFWRS